MPLSFHQAAARKVREGELCLPFAVVLEGAAASLHAKDECKRYRNDTQGHVLLKLTVMVHREQ